MRPSVLGAEPGEAPCGHPRLVSSAHLAPRPSRPSALSPSARVRPGCSWEEPRLAARSHLVSVASQVTVPAVTALPLVTGPRPPFPLRRMPHSQGPGRRGRQQRRTHGVGGVGRGRPQGRAGRCPEQTGLLHAHTVSLQTCLRGWRSGSCHRSPPRKQTRTPRPTAPHRCTPVADAGAAGQLSWSKQEGSQYPEFSPPGVGRRRGNSLKKKKRYGIFRAVGSPTSAYQRPGSCAGPRHWDTQGDRRASPSRSRMPSLLGDSRGGGEPRGQRCTQPLGAPHGSLPRKSLPGQLHRAPRHRHHTQTPGEVVKWLQRLVVGDQGVA